MTASTKSFVHHLSTIQLDNIFNPYRDYCPVYDRHNAPSIRRANLRIMIDFFRGKEDLSLWIARDLGHRGGRRTGLAMSDDFQLAKFIKKNALPLKSPVKGEPIKEQTATIVWTMIERTGKPVMLWNIFPFHPHEPTKPQSNRCHSASERAQTAHILPALVKLIAPSKLVTIGREAKLFLPEGLSDESDMKIHHTRHPSCGGKSQFISQLETIYGL